MSATAKIWSNGVAPSCEDDDLNGFKNENNNLIVGSGQSLSTADNQQTHKAVAHYAGVGDFYADSGSANTYVLGVTGTQIKPPTYATGLRIRFVAGNANTGASTVNVAGLGVEALVRDDTGAALTANDVRAGDETRAYYDGTSFRVTSTIPFATKISANINGVVGLLDSTVTVIPFDTEDFDTRGEFVTGAAARFTPTEAGYYSANAVMALNGPLFDADEIALVTIRKNGAATNYVGVYTAVVTKTIDIRVSATALLFMNGTTDYIDATAYQNSQNAVDYISLGATYIHIHRVL